MIHFDAVSKLYASTTAWALHPTTFTIEAGEFLVLLGESGSGKTTLLKMVNRLVQPSAGAVRVFERDVREQDPISLRRGMGYVIQSVGLFPHFSVADNVAVVPRLLKWPESQVRERVDELLERVGLSAAEYRARAPHQLSGGQRQRVGIARALAARPKILLLDEPFGALDALTRAKLQLELRRLHEALGLTTLLVTHDLAEALTLADRIAVLRSGELRQLGTPAQLLHAPADAYVAELIQSVVAQAARVSELARRASS
jgi:osmoprotectant transport system ATP-binding protein